MIKPIKKDVYKLIKKSGSTWLVNQIRYFRHSRFHTIEKQTMNVVKGKP